MTKPANGPEEVTPAAPSPGRLFTLGQVLTLACGNTEAQQMFCSYAELLDVLGFMLNDVPLAEAIPDAIEQCRPAVLLQRPELAHVEPPRITAPDAAVLAFLADHERDLGATLTLTPIEED